MIKLISNFVINRKGVKESEEIVRRIYGTVSSIVGICLNVLLFVGKYIAGMLSGSVAIMADAFNNLSDAGSSFITLIGFRFAGKKPDMDHPFGHGRFEYISGFVVSMLILTMGIELIKTAIKKIVKPKPVEVEMLTIAILVISILVKLYMVYYNKRIGDKIKSSAMKATAMDSLGDVVATSVVLVATIVMEVTGVNLDGYLGVAVALFVLYAGFSAAKETIGTLLGKSPDPEFVKAIKDIVMDHDKIVGIHDMIVHDYGPGRVMVSLHAEVPGDGDIYELHDAIDHIERELTERLGCNAVIHMDPIETDNEVVNQLKCKVEDGVKLLIDGASIHDFRVVQGPSRTNLIFDVAIPYTVKENDDHVKERICKMVQIIDSNYFAVVTVDRYSVTH